MTDARTSSFSSSPRQLPPRVAGLPGLGSALPLLRNPLTFLRRAHAEHGPIFEVRAPTRRFVVLAGREANRFVGGEGRDAFISGPFWGRLTEYNGCPHALVAVDGEPHRAQRKHYGEVLSRELVDVYAGGCDALVRDTFGRDAEFSVRDECRLLVARLVHHCLTQGDEAVDVDIARALMEVFRWESNTLLLGKWPRIALKAPTYRRHRAKATAFMDGLIAAQAAASDEAPLTGWFERVRQGRLRFPELFTEGDLRMALALPFFAGVDTVGSTLGFVLYELHRNPAMRARVEAEVAAADAAADGLAPAADLRSLTALGGLVIECLRLYPAAFAMYRGAARDFEFADKHVAKGTDVLLFSSATHFDDAYFPDADRLDVDRHAPPRSENRQKHVLMPYGAGPHVCLGAGMGEAMLLAATASMVRNHRFTMPDAQQTFGPVFDPSLTIDPAFRLQRAG